jgi:hypothetical protein
MMHSTGSQRFAFARKYYAVRQSAALVALLIFEPYLDTSLLSSPRRISKGDFSVSQIRSSDIASLV